MRATQLTVCFTVVITRLLGAQQAAAGDLATQDAELRVLVRTAPSLPSPAAIDVIPPSAGWQMGMVSWAAEDRGGLLYLLQRGADADPVVVVDRDGRVVRSWGRGRYRTPHAIRLDPDGNVWTTDARSSLVIKYNPQGEQLMEIAVGGQPADCDNGFCGVTDVAFAPDGRLFVSDGYRNARIIEYTAEGRRVGEWGEAGTGPGQFNLPHSIVIDAEGVIYVADRENGRVQRFDLEGNFLGMWTSYGKTMGLWLGAGAIWLVTQPRGEPNGAPGWLLKVDPRSGKLLGAVDAERIHGVGGNRSGEVVFSPGPDNRPRRVRP